MANQSTPRDDSIRVQFRNDHLQHQFDDLIHRYPQQTTLDDINKWIAQCDNLNEEDAMLRVFQSIVNCFTDQLDCIKLYQLFEQFFNPSDVLPLVERKEKLIQLFGPFVSASVESLQNSIAQHRNVCLLLYWIWLEPLPSEQYTEQVLRYLTMIINNKLDNNEVAMYAVLAIQRIVIDGKLSNKQLKDQLKGDISSALKHYSALLESVDSPWINLDAVIYQLGFSSCWLLNQLEPQTRTMHLLNSPHLIVIDETNQNDPNVKKRRVPCLISPLLLEGNI